MMPEGVGVEGYGQGRHGGCTSASEEFVSCAIDIDITGSNPRSSISREVIPVQLSDIPYRARILVKLRTR
jgi:hypothetical protein